jgi:hypothetical protein
MTQKQILEGNKLIAKFMRIKFFRRPKFAQFILGDIDELKWKDSNGELISINNLKYHSSWDWLIPACQKWDNLMHTNSKLIGSKLIITYLKKCDTLDNIVACYEILPVFEQLVKNIKWYNGLDTEK